MRISHEITAGTKPMTLVMVNVDEYPPIFRLCILSRVFLKIIMVSDRILNFFSPLLTALYKSLTNSARDKVDTMVVTLVVSKHV